MALLMKVNETNGNESLSSAEVRQYWSMLKLNRRSVVFCFCFCFFYCYFFWKCIILHFLLQGVRIRYLLPLHSFGDNIHYMGSFSLVSEHNVCTDNICKCKWINLHVFITLLLFFLQLDSSLPLSSISHNYASRSHHNHFYRFTSVIRRTELSVKSKIFIQWQFTRFFFYIWFEFTGLRWYN